MSHLSKLNIGVGDLKQEELESLGSLPSLDELKLFTHRPRLLVIRANGFRQLLYFQVVSGTPGHIVFQPQAMPKVQTVSICISLRIAKEEAAANAGDWFDLRMGNLSSLRHAVVIVKSSGVTVGEAKQAEAALENSLRAHPNRPIISVYMRPPIPQGTFLKRKTLPSLRGITRSLPPPPTRDACPRSYSHGPTLSF
jgi:hypothetical protein